MKIDSLSGQHVAILGGSSGIGLGTAGFLLAAIFVPAGGQALGSAADPAGRARSS